MTTDYYAVEDIIQRFNFYKVHIAMAAVGWKYWDTPYHTPSVEKLKDTARGMLISLVDNPESARSSTGGFVASRYKDKNGEEFLHLEFVLESSNNDK